MVRILALTKYGKLAASTRQRFVQYYLPLRREGIEVDFSPFLNDEHLRRLSEGRRSSAVSVLRSYARRTGALASAGSYDLLWVHCELFPYLPGFAEAAGVAIGRTPVLFDYDDAIFHAYDQSPSALVRHLLGGKLEPLLRSARACCCGNEYLRSYAARYCERTYVFPTVVDTDIYRPAQPSRQHRLVVGWIGSPTTWNYVRPLLPLLRQLCAQGKIRFVAVGAGAGASCDMFPGMELVEWREEREVSDVQSFDIGIMPLPDEPWARGKSGYKLIQYMACGLPVIASPVGVNSTIVRAGENGFLATDVDEWRQALEALIMQPEERRTFGAAGRKQAVEHYSLQVHAPRLVKVIRDAIG